MTSVLVLVLLFARHVILNRLHHLFTFQIPFLLMWHVWEKKLWWSYIDLTLYDFFLINLRKYLRSMVEETVVDKGYETLLVFYCCVTNHRKNNTHLWFQFLGLGMVVCGLVWLGSHQAAIKMSAATGVSSDTQSPLFSSLVVSRIQFLEALGLSSPLSCWLFFSDPRVNPPFLATVWQFAFLMAGEFLLLPMSSFRKDPVPFIGSPG